MTCTFLFLYYQPSWTTTFVSVASCRLIGEESYIAADVSMMCYTSQHLVYTLAFVLPVLLLLILVVPFFLWRLLRKNRHDLDKITVILSWGMLYNEYRHKAYFWEILKIVQKSLLMLFLNFYASYIVIKGVIVYLLIITYTVLANKYMPYRRSELNLLDMLSANICSISILLGVTAYKNQLQYVQIICFVVILAINVFFLLKIFSKIFKGYFDQYEDKVELLVGKLAKVCPCVK